MIETGFVYSLFGRQFKGMSIYTNSTHQHVIGLGQDYKRHLIAVSSNFADGKACVVLILRRSTRVRIRL